MHVKRRGKALKQVVMRTLLLNIYIHITITNNVARFLFFSAKFQKETLQYCDKWRKFTSVSQTVSQSVVIV